MDDRQKLALLKKSYKKLQNDKDDQEEELKSLRVQLQDKNAELERELLSIPDRCP